MNFQPQLTLVAGLAILSAAAIGLLRVAYGRRRPSPLPRRAPGLCLLPKFRFSIPLAPRSPGDADCGDALARRLSGYGFVVREDSERGLVFERGAAFGELSIKTARVVIKSPRPISNPAEVRVEYGAVLGTLLDTGDLWQFCRELADKVEDDHLREEQLHPLPPLVDTGNPYQAPPP